MEDIELQRRGGLKESMKRVEQQIDRDGEYRNQGIGGSAKEPCEHCGQGSRLLDADKICPRCQRILGLPPADTVEELDNDDELQEVGVEGEPWTVWIHDLDAAKRNIGVLLSGKDHMGRSVVGRVVKTDPSTFRVLLRELEHA